MRHLVECDVPNPIRCSCLEQIHQLPDPIHPNAITNPLQVLENRLESQDPEPHHRGGEAGHPHIRAHIHKNPISPFAPKPPQELLNRHRYVRPPEGLPLERPDYVLVGLIGKRPEIRERVEERVLDALDDVSDHGVSLWRREAVEGGDGGGREAGLGGEGGGVGTGERDRRPEGEEVEDEKEEGGGEEEEEEPGGEELGLLVPLPRVSHWRDLGSFLRSRPRVFWENPRLDLALNLPSFFLFLAFCSFYNQVCL